jgi:RNA recognition motif-containing protein
MRILELQFLNPAVGYLLPKSITSFSILPIESGLTSTVYSLLIQNAMNLFVANVSRDVTEEALKALFSEFGTVTSAKIITDRATGQTKGFGFVEMPNDQEANTAMSKLTNANFFGKNLVVSKARPKPSSY